LATVNFPLSEAEFEAVTKKYLSKDDDNLLYIDFINDNYRPVTTLDE